MHMRVNESGDHQLSARVNHLVGSAVEALADKDDLRALVDEFGVAPEHVAAARIADKPAALDLRSHALWTSGGGPVVGWLDTKVFDETGDAAKAQGWTALLLDTDGNGKRAAYVRPN